MHGQKTLDPVTGKKFFHIHPQECVSIHLFSHSKGFLANNELKRAHSMMNTCMRSG